MVGVENLYAGMLSGLFDSDPMQLIRKLVNSELKCIQHQRFFDLHCGSWRSKYKRKDSKKKIKFKS